MYLICVFISKLPLLGNFPCFNKQAVIEISPILPKCIYSEIYCQVQVAYFTWYRVNINDGVSVSMIFTPNKLKVLKLK